jgi:hypothetical protein|tara:strand:+ start:741 stop:1166 length:426 start_codon:yes stop_codon:yes gene_type:complete
VLQSLVRSVGITCTVSAIVAYFLTHFQIIFVKSFLLTTLLQFIVWYLIGYANEAKTNAINRELEADMYKEFSKQFSEVNCAFCSTKSNIPIVITGNNEFECSNCGKRTAVYVNLEVAQTTTAVEDPTDRIIEKLTEDGIPR